MTTCKQCGTEILEGEKFCPHCGKPVSQGAGKKQPAPMMPQAPMMQAPMMPQYGCYPMQQAPMVTVNTYGCSPYGCVQQTTFGYGYEEAPEQRERPDPEAEVEEAEAAMTEGTEEGVDGEDVEETVAKPVNGFSVAGFVLSFFPIINILGILFSIIGIARAKKYNGAGKALGIAGLIIGVVILAAVLVLFFMNMKELTDIFTTAWNGILKLFK